MNPSGEEPAQVPQPPHVCAPDDDEPSPAHVVVTHDAPHGGPWPRRAGIRTRCITSKLEVR